MKNPIEIKDLNAPELDVYARISEVQLLRYYEPDPGLFVGESLKVIDRALTAGYEPVSFLVEHKELEGEAGVLVTKYPEIPVYTAEYEVLAKLTGYAMTRGVLAVMRRKELPSVEEVCQNARRIAVLENVVNPTNIGAIFRSAAALHMDAVLLSPGCCDPLYRRAARVSMGTVFQIPGPALIKKSPGPDREWSFFGKWDLRQRLWLLEKIRWGLMILLFWENQNWRFFWEMRATDYFRRQSSIVITECASPCLMAWIRLMWLLPAQLPSGNWEKRNKKKKTLRTVNNRLGRLFRMILF